MAWGADHQKIHLSFRLYEQPSYDAPPVSYTAVGSLVSPDAGRTWTRLDGTPVELAATVDTADIIVRTQSAEGRILDGGAMALSPDGVPFIGYCVRMADSSEAYLATPRPGGGWRHVHLNRFLPAAWRNAALAMFGGVTFNGAGQPVVIVPVMHLTERYQGWSEPSTELMRFDSTDGGRTFTARLVDEPDPTEPRWLPSLERPTGFNEMPAAPGLIYTSGASGAGLGDVLSNKVCWRVLD